MPRLKHVPSFDGAFTHDGETWDMEDGIFEVEDESVAADIVEQYTKISYANPADVEETPTPEPEETTFQCGVNDCSREVDSPEATCWQHQD